MARSRRQHRGHVHGQGRTQGIADQLEHDLGIQQPQGLAARQTRANAVAEHVEIRHAQGRVQGGPQHTAVPQNQGNPGTLAHSPPAVHVLARQHVLDKADRGMALQFAQQRQHRRHRARRAAAGGSS